MYKIKHECDSFLAHWAHKQRRGDTNTVITLDLCSSLPRLRPKTQLHFQFWQIRCFRHGWPHVGQKHMEQVKNNITVISLTCYFEHFFHLYFPVKDENVGDRWAKLAPRNSAFWLQLERINSLPVAHVAARKRIVSWVTYFIIKRGKRESVCTSACLTIYLPTRPITIYRSSKTEKYIHEDIYSSLPTAAHVHFHKGL